MNQDQATNDVEPTEDKSGTNPQPDDGGKIGYSLDFAMAPSGQKSLHLDLDNSTPGSHLHIHLHF